MKVALTTGFARATQEAIVSALGWWSEIDLVLSPADAGRGRPFPDLVLVAAHRLGSKMSRRSPSWGTRRST